MEYQQCQGEGVGGYAGSIKCLQCSEEYQQCQGEGGEGLSKYFTYPWISRVASL